MPEGPEIKTSADQLKFLEDCIVYQCNYKDGKRVINMDKVEQGCKVKKVYSYSKKLLIKLSCGYTLICSYGMNSGWYFEKKPHTVVSLIVCSYKPFDSERSVQGNNEEKIKIYKYARKIYFEIVRFGTIEAKLNSEMNRYLNQFGPDPLFYSHLPLERIMEEKYYDEYLDLMSVKKVQNWEICKLLLDQRCYLTGVGNYLRAEILYRARLRPDRKVNTLSKKELLRLYKQTHIVMRESYMSGGLTIESFFPPNGERGMFKKVVYDQEFDPLGNKVIKQTFSCGRNCYWVKEVQR